jgi:hypothetical protein
MKKFALPLVILSMLVLATACGSSSDSSDSYEDYTEPVSEATVYPFVSGSAVALDCDDAWTCYSEYGDATIQTSGSYAGAIQVVEMYDGYNTVDAMITSYQTQEVWSDVVLVDEYDFSDGEVAVLESASAGKIKWMLLKDVEGKTDYRVRCEATIDTAEYENYQSSIESICSTVRAE